METPELLGRYRVCEKVVDLPDFEEYRAEEVGEDGTTRIRSVSRMSVEAVSPGRRPSVLADLNALRECSVVNVPPILEVGSAGDKGDSIVVVSEWGGLCPLSRLIQEYQPTEPRDVALAFYVLHRLFASLDKLHAQRLQGQACVHGALAPDCVWIDQDANIFLHNHVYALVLSPAATEADDVEGLRRLLTDLVTGSDGTLPVAPAIRTALDFRAVPNERTASRNVAAFPQCRQEGRWDALDRHAKHGPACTEALPHISPAGTSTVGQPCGKPGHASDRRIRDADMDDGSRDVRDAQ